DSAQSLRHGRGRRRPGRGHGPLRAGGARPAGWLPGRRPSPGRHRLPAAGAACPLSVDPPGALPYCRALRARPTSTMTKTPLPQAEFSRPIAVDQIGLQETEREIIANPAERARLVERFGLLALDRLSAAVGLKRGRGGLIHVRGRLEAEVVQACVVT